MLFLCAAVVHLHVGKDSVAGIFLSIKDLYSISSNFKTRLNEFVVFFEKDRKSVV